jgi:putative ABC transport system permease protein
VKQQSIEPPRFAVRFLHWFCPPQLIESIEGDLIQQFEDDLVTLTENEEATIRTARRRFIINVLRFFRPEIFLRNKFSLQLFQTVMVKNYIKVARRNMMKRKLYSFINAFGLSIGIAFCMLIFLYIEDERSFDQFHTNKHRIYRLEEKSYDVWQPDPSRPYNESAYLPSPLLQAVKDEVPEVQYGTRFNDGWNGAMRYQDKVFTEKFALADADFFKMFSFRLLKGNREKLFQNPNEIVITPEIAEKYFGKENPLGKTVSLFLGKEKLFTVTGVIEGPPANSSIDFKMLVPIQSKPNYEADLTKWGNFSYPMFIQLSENADATQLAGKFDQVVNKYMGDRLVKWRKEGNVPDSVKVFELKYTALPDIHMKTSIGWHKVSNPQYALILGGIALLILIIACINYVSLALTTSTSRRVEVGVRKVVGADRKEIIFQFGFESIILALISMFFAIGLTVLALPSFNTFTGKLIQLDVLVLLKFTVIALMLSVVVGMLAGSYPSLFLSSFKPATVLKGSYTSRLQLGVTKPLVVFQFVLSAFLIISSLIMYRQMNFIANKNLGYDHENIVVIPTQAGWEEASTKVVEQMRVKLANDPQVEMVAGTNSSFNQGYSRYGYKINDEQKSSYVYAVDPYYIPTLGLELVMGRNFDESIVSDSNALIVNEALVADMKWDDPLNEYLNFTEDSLTRGHRIIGVVKNYHFLSLERDIEPMFLSIDRRVIGHLTSVLVKLKTDDLRASIDNLQKTWKELYPDKPFDYTFLDEDVKKQYESYDRWMSIMGLSTVLAILIACLGLFGLSGINAVNKTKEIGIRKVLGAELSSIFVLLNRQYIILALIAFVLATPLSWYVMNEWLSDFKYKVTIGWELFAIGMLSGLVVALITVSYHAIKAASVNPASTLKYE